MGHRKLSHFGRASEEEMTTTETNRKKTTNILTNFQGPIMDNYIFTINENTGHKGSMHSLTSSPPWVSERSSQTILGSELETTESFSQTSRR